MVLKLFPALSEVGSGGLVASATVQRLSISEICNCLACVVAVAGPWKDEGQRLAAKPGTKEDS